MFLFRRDKKKWFCFFWQQKILTSYNKKSDNPKDSTCIVSLNNFNYWSDFSAPIHIFFERYFYINTHLIQKVKYEKNILWKYKKKSETDSLELTKEFAFRKDGNLFIYINENDYYYLKYYTDFNILFSYKESDDDIYMLDDMSGVQLGMTNNAGIVIEVSDNFNDSILSKAIY